MQNCFREYPEVYGSELDADDDEDDDMTAAPASAETSKQSSTTFAPQADSAPKHATNEDSVSAQATSAVESNSKPSAPGAGLVPEEYRPERKHNPVFDARGDMSSVESEKEKSKQKPKDEAKKADAQVKSQEPVSESKNLVPKASHDAGEPGTEKLARR
jgi:intermembrane space import and assembly protein 40